MTQLLSFTRASVDSFNGSLRSMHEKMLRIDVNRCDINDEIYMVQSIIDEEDDTITSLATFENELDEFVSDVVIVDNEAGILINTNKEDFYKKYSYLKPECEKNAWDKTKDALKKPKIGFVIIGKNLLPLLWSLQ